MEYLPSKAFSVLKTYITVREDVPIVLNDSNAIISNYEKTGTNMHFDIFNIEADTKIELPYIYYLGYRVYINGKEIQYSESENGFVEISLSKNMRNMSEADTAKVVVKYTGTNEMIAATIISIISLVGLLIVTKITQSRLIFY